MVVIPCKSEDYFLNGCSVKTIVLVGIYNQQFQGTINFNGSLAGYIFHPTWMSQEVSKWLVNGL